MMPRMRRKEISIVLAGLFAALSAVSATTVLKMTLPEVVAAAELIVEGKVLSVEGYRDARGMICSKVLLQAAQYLKGSGGSYLEFSIPGGFVGDQGLLIPGFPQFRPGEDSILFLSKAGGTGIRLPEGLGQGKYRVLFDPETGRKLVRRESLQGLELLSPETGQLVPSDPAGVVDYGDFVAEVRRLVGGAK